MRCVAGLLLAAAVVLGLWALGQGRECRIAGRIALGRAVAVQDACVTDAMADALLDWLLR